MITGIGVSVGTAQMATFTALQLVTVGFQGAVLLSMLLYLPIAGFMKDGGMIATVVPSVGIVATVIAVTGSSGDATIGEPFPKDDPPPLAAVVDPAQSDPQASPAQVTSAVERHYGVTVAGEQKSTRVPLSEIAGPVLIQHEKDAPAETCRLTLPGNDQESEQRVVLLCNGSEPRW